MRISIVIATRGRHSMLEQSVPTMLAQDLPPHEILIVDTSPTKWSKLISDKCVHYYWLPDGAPNRNWQRNFGISRANGEIVVLPDDDILPSRAWLSELAKPYTDSDVGAVGGRVIEGPDIPTHDRTEVSTIRWWGQVEGNFRAITPGAVEVPHLKGCNISFRADLLKSVGGYDERIDGWAMRDETDLCMRIRRAGYKIIYAPAAVVEHFGFSLWTSRDLRIEPAWTAYSGAKTTTYFVFRNLGFGPGLIWMAYTTIRPVVQLVKALGRLIPRPFLSLAGVAAGALQATLPRRHDGLQKCDTVQFTSPEIPATEQAVVSQV